MDAFDVARRMILFPVYLIGVALYTPFFILRVVLVCVLFLVMGLLWYPIFLPLLLLYALVSNNRDIWELDRNFFHGSQWGRNRRERANLFFYTVPYTDLTNWWVGRE